MQRAPTSSRCVMTLLALGFLSLSCATIREVKKVPGKSGVVTVHEGMGGDAREMARQKMRENCGAQEPVVVEEGEAVVGKTSEKRMGSYATITDMEDKREWRLTYKCKSKMKGKGSN